MSRHARHLIVAIAFLGLSGVARADDGCTAKTLRGRYIFTATGDTIVAGVPQPKTIIEVLEFDGQGIVSAPQVTRSLNGVVARVTGEGDYTVDASCSGTITFDAPAAGIPAVTFDVFFSRRADTLWMIQTNQGSVFQGTATRLSHRLSTDRDPD
jgi:hypothetical protein